jgi:hypothetical protein
MEPTPLCGDKIGRILETCTSSTRIPTYWAAQLMPKPLGRRTEGGDGLHQRMELGVSLPRRAQDHEITQDQNNTQAEIRAESALGLRPTRHRAIFGLLHDTLPRDTNLRWSIA